MKGPDSPQLSVSTTEIDRSINEVMGRAEYSWRMPREKPEKKKGLISEFIAGVLDTLAEWLKPVKKWFGKILGRISKHLEKCILNRGEAGQGEAGWPDSIYIMLYVILAAAACLLALLLLRALKKPRKERAEAAGDIPIHKKPDLSDENVSAAELPSNMWMELALELADKGDLRLALRAFYLAGLAHLSLSGMITIAVFKSNREYEKELGRKAHDRPDLLSAFSHNTGIFESIWYGAHEVTDEIFSVFNENQKRIMALAAR